jgi:hypothetical protein
VVYAWLFNRSGGSVLFPLLAHAVEGCVRLSTLWPADEDVVRAKLCYSLTWTALATAVLLLDRQAWVSAPASAREAVADAGPFRLQLTWCDRRGAFGAIFLLQGVNDLTHVEFLRHVAFDVLGHEVERLLPDVVYVWFVALLLAGSAGKSRFLGWVVMLIVVGLEIVTLATLLLARPMASVKVLILLPFVWLRFESAEPDVAAARTPVPEPRAATRAAGR